MTTPRNVLIIGDSHAKGFLPHTRVDSDAIAERLGSPDALRLAISGSTARQWALDRDGRLTHAQLAVQTADAVLISMGGNDLFEMAADGKVDEAELSGLGCHLTHILTAIAVPSKRAFVLLYGYPFKDIRPQAMSALFRLNDFIAGIVRSVNEIFGTQIETLDERLILLAGDWPGDDIHPFRSGYERIGDEILRRLDVKKGDT